MNFPVPAKGIIASIVLYLVLSLACTQIPLFNYLGFEFALVIALVGSFTSGLLTADALHRFFVDGKTGHAGFEFRRMLRINLLLLSIPLFVMTANALLVKNCSLLEGIAFFFLLPVVSVWFSSCLGFFCGAHYRHPKAVFTAIVALTLGYAAFLGYTTPAIYSYNFFYGYFPGLTYDEVLEISWTLLLFRVITLFLGVLLYRMALILSDATGRRTREKGMELFWSLLGPGRKWWTITVVVLLLIIFLYRTELGFESSSGSIQRDLGASFETPHFTIYYADSAYQRGEILWLAAEHEFRLDQINKELERPYEGRIRSYIYPGADAKRRHVGAGNTSIAKPWSGEVHLHSPADVLKHELVHLAAAPFGVPILRASIHPGLTEGLAMAIEWDWGNRTLHEYSAGMIRAGLDPGMESIMSSLGFAGQSSSLSYVLAGSFCRHLIDRYGISDFTRLYGTGDYEAVLGEALPELVTEWKTMLSAIAPDEGMNDVTDVYFRSPPIFGKTCARVTAKKLAEARKQFAARQYDLAAESYVEAYVESRSTEAFSGLLVSNLRLGRTASILAAKDSVFRADTTARLLPLYPAMGDACWLEGRIEEARGLYEKTARANFSRSSLEGSLIRLHVLDDSLATGFRSYLLSDQPDSIRITILDGILLKKPDHPLALYLRGRLLVRLGRYDEAVREMDSANLLSIESRLETGRLMARGDALFRMKAFDNAIASYEEALRSDDSMALMDEVEERVARCRWFAENNMPDALESAQGKE